MDSYSTAEDAGPTFCIGHHEADRSLPVTPQVVRRAHESNVGSSYPERPNARWLHANYTTPV